MSKIASIVEARMREAAAKVETDALTDLHRVAVDMSRIADSVNDRVEMMEKQVRMMNAPRPKPLPVPLHRQPLFLLQVAVVMVVLTLISSLIFALWPGSPMVCRPGKNQVLICKKI